MDIVKRRNFIAKALHLPPQLFSKKQPRDHPHHHQQLQLLHPNSVVEGKNNDTLNIDVDGTGLNGGTIRTVLQNNIERRRAKPKQEEEQEEEATGEELATAKRLVHSQSSPAGQLPLCEFDSAAKERPANRQQRQEQRQSKNPSTEPKMQSSSSAEDADNQQTTTKKGMGGGGRGGKAVRFVSDHEDEARAERQEEEEEEEEERADESDVEDNAEEEEKGGEREKELVAALRTEMERRKRTDQRGNGNGGIGQGQTQQQQHKNSTSSAGEEEQSQRQQIERLREAHFELERAQKSVQFLQFQIQEKDVQFNELKERMDNLQNQLQRDMERKNAQLAEYERLLAAANTKIEQLLEQEHDKQQTIDGLHKKLSQAFEAASMGSRGMNGTMEQEEGGQNDSSEEGNQNGTQDEATDGSPNGMTEPEAIANLRTEIGKLEQKLQSATEEKDYYKKHFKGEQQPAAHNGHSVGPNHLTDDFGKELMLANKRKYQLEGRMKQLERELREVQQRATHLDESLKSTEKLLWLEKERTATLENEREQLNRELNELRKEADTMRRDLEAHRGEGNHPFFSEREHQEDLNKLRAECDQRYNELRDMKNKVEWRMGEVTQSYHDTKWRLGEIESTLAHRDWQLEQANNRIKELEGSLIASDPAKLSDELNKLKQELGKVCEEKGKLEWRVGEVTQWWNDAKWRVGELESESAHRSHLLDKAHHKIGELERKLENYACGFDLSKAYNDAKWRVGELEAEVGRIRYEKDQAYKEVNELKEQKGKMEWRLGEVTQWWNEAKWKINELEERMGRGGGGGVEIWSNSGLEKKLVDVEAANERLRSLVQDETFLVRKQPHADRKKWKTLTFENMRNASMRRVWFETDAGNAKQVFLIGSFLNWECALLCEPVPEKPKRVGIWVDMPLGRIEFSFLRDGQWQHGSEYSWTWTQHGTKNNVMFVE